MTETLARIFNESLVRSNTVLTVRAYIKRINDEVFQQPISDFADDLLDMVLRDDCCIPHDKLMKYGVVAEGMSLGNITRLLEQHSFIEGVDFCSLMSRSAGGRPAKTYLLRPEAFEQCIIRSRNTDKYTRFYTLLRKCVTLYDKYQLAMERQKTAVLRQQNEVLTSDNADLRSLITEMRAELRAENKQINSKVDVMTTEIKDVKVQNREILTGLHEVKRQTDAIAVEAHRGLTAQLVAARRQANTAVDIAVPPEDLAKCDTLLLLHLTDRKYAALRVQAKGVSAAIRRQKATYPNLRKVLHLLDLPNGKYLWMNGREVLKNKIQMLRSSATTFTLNPGVTEEEVAAILADLSAEPIGQAVAACDAAKASVTLARDTIASAVSDAARTMTRVTTITETVKLSAEEIEDLLAGYLD